MIIRGLGRLSRWRNKVEVWLQQRVIILLYHRVASLESDPHLLSVSPHRFDEHLAILRRRYKVLSLQDLQQVLLEDKLPRRGVVVTFDDGYADNLYNAKPLLEKHHVPATMFVSTGAIGYPREFWWDELEHILLHPGTLPQALAVSAGSQHYNQDLDGAETYSNADYQKHRSWHAMLAADPTSRHTTYRSLCQWMHPLPIEERQQALTELLDWSGSKPSRRPSHRTLTAEEVPALARGGLVEVGAHTINHHSLASLDVATQKVEIERSKVELETLLGYPVTSFSYPFGTRADYTTEMVDIVKAAGFDIACSNFEGVVQAGCNRFQLPRFVVRNWDGDEFIRHLNTWFNYGA